MMNPVSGTIGTAVSFSLPIIPLIIIFVVATVMVIVSIALRKSGAAKVLNILTIILCSVSILLTGTFGIRVLTANRSFGVNAIDSSLTDIFKSHRQFLKSNGFSDVRIKLADLSPADGKEAVFYYYNGNDHVVEVYALSGKNLQSIFSKKGDEGSIYLVKQNGIYYLLDYIQDISADYTQSYSYELFRFDDDFSKVSEDKNSLTVAADAQGGGSAGVNFFAALNSYLADAQVCYDPYSLMGYTIMQSTDAWGGSSATIDTAEKYLRITNCSTNKIGIVTMKKDTSWLNFRSGPGRNYDPVLIDPADKESYVKQTQHSIVTVIIPENTTNADYPVWYKIRITYKNRTLEGYSAQTYINVENITKVAKGSKFTVEAETNDTGITWTSSDSSVAAIDPDTGEITAKKAGVVLITVGTDSELSDSCLIMVE